MSHHTTTTTTTTTMMKSTQQSTDALMSFFSHATASSTAKVCVIAEIGVNHDGSVTRAAELIRAAADTGADAVKFQYFDPRHLLSNQALLADYQKSSATDPFAMLDGLRLSLDELCRLRDLSHQHKLLFFVTPFSLPQANALSQLQPDAVKIASPDAVNPPLLQAAASAGSPLIVSTGTCELAELEFVASLLRHHAAGGALLHCVSSYPTPVEHAALGGIAALRERFHLPVGYSDHTTSLLTGAFAVASGACVIEKHLTYDPMAAGPDHAASFSPETFTQYVRHIRKAQAMLGCASKTVSPVEQDVRFVSRQSLCAARDIPAGTTLTAADLTVKRPGTGIPATRFDEVVGRTTSKALRANDLLTDEDLLAVTIRAA